MKNIKKLLITTGIIILISTTISQAATVKPKTPDLITTDVLGYPCVSEDDLDAAFFNNGKGANVPQTCMEKMPPKDCEILTDLIGRKASADECATFGYRWLTVTDPNKIVGWGFNPKKPDHPRTPVHPNHPIKPPEVPLPLPLVLLATGLLSLRLLMRKASNDSIPKLL